MFEIAEGIALTSSAFDGVAAYHVLGGSMQLDLPCGTRFIARPDTLMLVPAGLEPSLSLAGNPVHTYVDGRACVRRRGPWTIADATGGRETRLMIAAARIVGTSPASIDSPVLVPLARDRTGRRLSALLRDEVANPGAASAALAIAVMTSCIIVALRQATAPTTSQRAAGRSAHALVGRAVTAVRSEPGGAHSINSMAKLSGMSRSTFVRQFTRSMQVSPMKFLQQIRLTEAAAMLRTSLLPVKTIAAQTGFASRSHFSRVFRLEFGRDPSAFRDGEADTDQLSPDSVGQAGARADQ